MTLRVFSFAALGLVGTTIVVALIGLAVVPAGAQIPIHYSAGEADRFAGRTEALLLFTLIQAFLAVVGAGVIIRERRRKRTTSGAPHLVLLGMVVILALHLSTVVSAAST